MDEADKLGDAQDIGRLAFLIWSETNMLPHEGRNAKHENEKGVKQIQEGVYKLNKKINDYNNSYGQKIDTANMFKLIHSTARISEALGYTDVEYFID